MSVDDLPASRDKMASRATPVSRMHVHQRHTVQTAGQFVQVFRGLGVVQRAELLNLAQADRKHVVEISSRRSPP